MRTFLKFFYISYFLLLYFFTENLYSFTINKNNKYKINAYKQERIIISFFDQIEKNNKNNTIDNEKCKLIHYDKKFLLLIKKIDFPFLGYIFQILNKEGKAKIQFSLKNKTLNYTIIINSDVFYNYFNKKSNKNNKSSKKITLNLNNKKKENVKKIKEKENLLFLFDFNKKNKYLKNTDSLHYKYINLLIDSNFIDEALKEIILFLNKYKKSKYISPLKSLKADLYLKMNKIDLSLQSYKDWFSSFAKKKKNDLKKGLILIKIAKIHERLKEIEEAKIIYMKIITSFKDDNLLAESYFNLGNIYFNEKKYEKGIKKLEKLIIKYPEVIFFREKSLFLLAKMYFNFSKIRNYKISYQYFKTLVKEYPKGKYFKEASKKLKFLDKNFINYY